MSQELQPSLPGSIDYSSSRPSSRFEWWQWGLLAAGFIYLFRFGLFDPLGICARVSPINGDPDWGHAVFVPLVSILYLMAHSPELKRAPVRVAWEGWIFFVAGVLLNIIGLFYRRDSVDPAYFVQGMALVLTLFGIVLLLGGHQVMKIAWFAVLYLAVAVPWPRVFTDAITVPLQHYAATWSVDVLQCLGMTVEQSGNQIQIFGPSGPPRMLNVAEACSGLRSVIAFMAIGMAVGFIPHRPMWRKIVIAVAGLPVAIGCNVIRIVGTGLLPEKYGKGFYHEFVGVMMIIPGMFMLIAFAWLLDKICGVSRPKPPKNPPLPPNPPTPRTYWAVLIVLIVSALGAKWAAAALGLAVEKEPVALRKDLTQLPVQLGSWQQVSTDVPLPDDVEAMLGTELYVVRNYVDRHRIAGDLLKTFEDHTPQERDGLFARVMALDPQACVQLGIYYYTGKNFAVYHTPDRCYVASGFTQIGDATDVVKNWTVNNKRLDVSFEQFEFRHDPLPVETRSVAFFFQVNGRYAPDRLAVRSAMLNPFERKLYFCKVEVMSPVTDAAQAKAEIQDFLSSALPEVESLLPGASQYPRPQAGMATTVP